MPDSTRANRRIGADTDDEWWERIASTLEVLLRLPVPDRGAALAHATGADRRARRELESLLRSAERMGDFLEGDAVVRQSLRLGTADDEAEPPDPLLGRTIGRFRVLRRIGRGAFGTVYEAEQSLPRRRVAVKVLRPSRLDPQHVRRFELEAQALARLDHPGIARVLDVGVFDLGEGVQPWLSLELVDGGSIVDAMRSQPLRTKIETLAAVCDAMHHAHQRGVIHRDLTSSNVLVERVDGHWRPRVVDFGTSRLIDPDDGIVVPMTGSGQVMGTLRWMSPEQLSETPVVLTTAVDVHALGVLAFVLLVGELPWDTADEPTDFGVIRAIRERPRRRLRPLDRRIDRDLEAIVQIALSIDPTARYASAAAMAADLRNWLDGRPLEGTPPSLPTAIMAIARRHRAVVASLSVASMALSIGVIATVIAAEKARSEAQRATQRFDEVRSLARSVLFELEPIVAGLPESSAARAVLCRRALQYLDGLEAEARDDSVLLEEIADGHERLADVLGHFEIPNLGDIDGCRDRLLRALALRERIELPPPDGRRNRIAIARLWFKIGRNAPSEPATTAAHAARARSSAEWALGAVERARSLLAEAVDDEVSILLAASASAAALVEADAGRLDEAERLVAEADAIAIAFEPRLSDPSFPVETRLRLGWILIHLAQFHSWHRRDAESTLETLDRTTRLLATVSGQEVEIRAAHIVVMTNSIRSDALWLCGDLNGAVDAARESLAMADRLAARDPDNARARRMREVALSRMAATYLAIGAERERPVAARRDAIERAVECAQRRIDTVAERVELGQLGWWESHYPDLAREMLAHAEAALADVLASADEP